jgi:pimeloyl-ACP methyl ester carboxylesterase
MIKELFNTIQKKKAIDFSKYGLSGQFDIPFIDKRTAKEIRLLGKDVAIKAFNMSWDRFPKITENVAQHFLFRSKVYQANSEEKKCQEKGRPFKVLLPTSRKEVKCWKWGTGPSIVFVHGWAGCGIQFYKFIPQIVEAGFSAVVFDYPSHGESDSSMTNSFEIYESLDVILKLLDSVHAIVGHSFGCGFALAGVHNFKVQKAILIGPQFNTVADFERWTSESGIKKEFFEKIICDLEAKYERTLQDLSPSEMAKKVMAPVLLFHDKEDKISKIENSQELVRDLDKGLLKETEGLGHTRILNDEETIKEAIKFLFEEVVS